MRRATGLVVMATGFALIGCASGAAVISSAEHGGLEQATWRDERTVALPPGSIEFDVGLMLRAQVASELGCPVGEVALADAIHVGEVRVVPVEACGARTYYAAIEGGRFRSVGVTPLGVHEPAPLFSRGSVSPEQANESQPNDDPMSGQSVE